jgi:acyl carrier protein
MTTSLDDRIVHLIAQVATVPEKEIRPADRLREDLGLDSVSSLELVSLICEELDVDIEVEETASVTTVAAVIQLAQRRVAGKA